LGGLRAVFVKVVHVVPPLIGILLEDEMLSQLLLDENLTCVIHPSEQYLLAKTFIVKTVPFWTVSAWNCSIAHCQIHLFNKKVPYDFTFSNNGWSFLKNMKLFLSVMSKNILITTLSALFVWKFTDTDTGYCFIVSRIFYPSAREIKTVGI
jgi:hypothetical protein